MDLLNINIVNEVQTGILVLLVITNLAVMNGLSIGTKQWARGIKLFSALTIFGFHASLYYMKVDWLLYYWFWSSMIHFWIHAFYAKFTIVQSGRPSFDEIWHFVNQLSVAAYMVIRKMDPIYYHLYLTFICIYFVLMTLFLWGYKWPTKPVYYLGSLMEYYFIYTLRPYSIVYLIPGFLVHTFVTWAITFNNPVGKFFILSNIAGAAFISEFFTLYFCFNDIYDSC